MRVNSGEMEDTGWPVTTYTVFWVSLVRAVRDEMMHLVGLFITVFSSLLFSSFCRHPSKSSSMMRLLDEMYISYRSVVEGRYTFLWAILVIWVPFFTAEIVAYFNRF